MTTTNLNLQREKQHLKIDDRDYICVTYPFRLRNSAEILHRFSFILKWNSTLSDFFPSDLMSLFGYRFFVFLHVKAPTLLPFHFCCLELFQEKVHQIDTHHRRCSNVIFKDISDLRLRYRSYILWTADPTLNLSHAGDLVEHLLVTKELFLFNRETL
ncbi:hypothetical protein GEMRC1_011733 [Eukaryota sp. GEM-RC1]